ncbi:MAG: hypothetical protein AB1716_10895, partial [Planctomycetota bacterium]
TLAGSGALRSDGGTISGGTLHQAAGHTIRGHGITVNLGLDNAGLLTSDTGGTIALRESAKSNSGAMQAQANSNLDIYTAVNQTGAGRIIADGGTVHLNTGANILGGKLETTGASVFQTDANTAILRDLTNLGTLTVGNGGVYALQGTLVNDGLIRAYWGGYYGNGILRFDTSPVTVNGAGEIRLEGGTLNGNEFVHAATHTLRGQSGVINAAFTNHGLVVADQNGGVLELRGDAKTNRGTLRAAGGGLLDLYVSINQVGQEGRIVADSGVVRLYNGSAVIEGALESSGSGHMVADATTAVLTNVTNRGDLRVQNGGVLLLTGSRLTNEGTVTLNWGGYYGNGIVRFGSNDLALEGPGTMILNGGTLTSPSGETFRNAATHTLRGGPGDVPVPLTNLGLIHADVASQSIALRAGDKNNAGVLKVSNGAYLDISTRIIQENNQGRIVADGGTVRLYNGASILTGTLETANGGSFVGDAVTCTLSSVTNRGLLRAGNGGKLVLQNGLVNEGTLEVYWGGYYGRGRLEFDTDGALSGTGEVHLVGGNLTSDTGATATVGAGQNVHGYDADIHVALDNFGTLASDTAGHAVNLCSAPKTNRNLLQATGSAYLDISVPVTQIENGRIVADGAYVRLGDGAAVLGGALETANGGQIYADARTCTLENVANRGSLAAGNGGRFIARGTLTNDGGITLYWGGYYGSGHLQLDTPVTLQGAGTLLLTSGDVASPGGYFLQNGAGHTITGTGPINVELKNGGIVAPGNGLGTLPVNAAYTHQVTAELRVELRGDGACDRLAVSGAAVLEGGALRVVPSGAAPRAGQQFVVATAGTLTGDFTTLAGPGIYTCSCANNQVTVTIVHGPGDVNCSGQTDFSDINPFVLALSDPAGYATQYPNCDIRTADCNGDGAVNFDDINPFVALLSGAK